MEKNTVKKEFEKGNNKSGGWFKENHKCLLFGLLGLLIGILVMGILWPDRTPQLKDGGDVIVELSNKKFTADDLYQELKKSSGLNALINLVDLAILNDKYDLDEEADEYAATKSEEYYSMYESYYGMSKEEFLTSNNFADEEVFLSYLKDEYLYQKYYEDYLESLVTEKELEDFYKDEVFGERKVYVFSATSENNNLEKVRSALKKGTKVTKLEDKYDGVAYTVLDSVKFDNEEYTTSFLGEVAKLEKGKYSKVFKDDMYGYVVVYVDKAEEKPTYEDALEGMTDVLAKRKDTSDGSVYYKSFIELRDAYKIKFHDEDLKKKYEDMKKQYTETEEETDEDSKEDTKESE